MSAHPLPSWAVKRRRRKTKRVLTRAAVSVAISVALLAPMSLGYFGRIDTIIADLQNRGAGRHTGGPHILNGGSAWGGVRATARPTQRMQVAIGPARVTHVRDGDTIEISNFALRLENLDCAELGTTAGERAKMRMQVLVRSAMVTCTLTGDTTYDRHVATCITDNAADLGSTLIAEGICSRE